MVGKTICFVTVKRINVHSTLLFALILSLSTAYSQENLEIYRGNSSYADGKFDEAKVHYDKALSNNPSSYKGNYNLGNANYKQENFEDAVSIYEQAIASSNTDSEKSDAFHNLGNTYLQSGKYEESIKAYKNALRINPQADDSRYNLAFSKKMMRQEEQQKNQENQNKDQEDKEEQKEENQDPENKDQEENQDQDSEDGEENEEDKQDDDNQDSEEDEQKEDKPKDGDQNEDGQEEAEPKPIQLTPREAEQLLEAAKNEDQKIQLQLKKKQKGDPRKIEKDW